MTAVDGFTVRSATGSYDVAFASGAAWVDRVSRLPEPIVLIDEVVRDLHRDRLAGLPEARIVTVKATEDTKSLPGVERLCDDIMQAGVTRAVTLVAVGGGVIQDVVGFLASILYRGVDWAYVPTTLLAQADSCIGSKTSINHRGFKNLLGTMKAPTLVVIDLAFVETLGLADYSSGLGEIAKMHLVAGPADAEQFEAALPRLLARERDAVGVATRRSLEIKRPFVEEDEFDRGPRRLLNYGHCFGHAIESATEFAVPHGQAVVLGMILAGLVANGRGYVAADASERVAHRMLLPLLTEAASAGIGSEDAVIAGMRRDKKRTGPGLAVVLPHADGSLTLNTDVQEDEARSAIQALPDILQRTH
jgi:3-dehydroquinate synthase